MRFFLFASRRASVSGDYSRHEKEVLTDSQTNSDNFLQERKTSSVNGLYRFGRFGLDPVKRQLFRDGEPVQVRPKAFETLLALVESKGQPFDKEDLIRRVWGGAAVEESGLARNISELRKLLGETPDQHRYIVTLPGTGYQFVAEVSTPEESTGAARVPGRSFGVGGRLAAVLTLLALVLTPGMLPKTSKPALPPVTLRPLTGNGGIEVDPSFSPDARHVVYAWDGDSGNLDIYVKALDDSAPVRLTSDAADERSPAWSPDGRWIAFVRYLPKQTGVFLVPPSGGAARQLLRRGIAFMMYSAIRSNLPAGIDSLAWYPDGKALAVAWTLSERERRCIVAVSIDTGESRPLTSPGSNADDSFPAISPDGKTLAFVRTYPSTENDIFVVPAAGGNPQPLIRGQRHVGGLAWTGDGREIIYSSDRAGGGYSLWRVALSGGGPQLVTAASNAWSPSLDRGARLAYTEATVDTNIWRLEASHGAAEARNRGVKLIGSTSSDDSPRFSPDGQRIVFMSARSGCNDVWICGRDGSSARRLTQCFGSTTGTPRWSPDGREIAFDASAGQPDVYVVSEEGGTPRRLTSTPERNVMPSWSRDARWIYYRSVRGADSNIWKVPAAGGTPVQITKRGGFEGFESPDGRFFYYTKDRGPGGIWRVPLNGGDEEAVPELANAGYWRYWTVAPAGIYFVPREAGSRVGVSLFDIGSRRVTQVAAVEHEPLWWRPGLDVSPDGRSILYLQADVNASAIKLMENFR